MKTLIGILAFLILLGLTSSKLMTDENSTGKVGDIIYSVLEPETFKELHGKDWILMDDKANISGSDLSEMGIILPDARGMFLRGMNCNRKDNYADKSGNRGIDNIQGFATGNSTRKISVKSSGNHNHTGNTNSVGNHSHSGTTSTNGHHSHQYLDPRDGGDKNWGHFNSEGWEGNEKSQTGGAGNHSHTFTTNTTGNHSHSFTSSTNGSHSHSLELFDPETRPNNIPVYIYIKINN